MNTYKVSKSHPQTTCLATGKLAIFEPIFVKAEYFRNYDNETCFYRDFNHIDRLVASFHDVDVILVDPLPSKATNPKILRRQKKLVNGVK